MSATRLTIGMSKPPSRTLRAQPIRTAAKRKHKPIDREQSIADDLGTAGRETGHI
jgi:hypothetical protein